MARLKDLAVGTKDLYMLDPASGSSMTDRWFIDKLRDCRARRKAAILRARHAVEVQP